MSTSGVTSLPEQGVSQAAAVDLVAVADRKSDIDAKHARIAALFQAAGCEALLALEPENFAWLTSGASARGIMSDDEHPALLFSADQRWLISSNADTQRLFDEELNELGFQVKEWPWNWGRGQLLQDICSVRKVASDRAFRDCPLLGNELRAARQLLTPYERACYLTFAPLVSHALEATCRTVGARETEREFAGLISHRLLHRGVFPVRIEAAADGRSKRYRRCGFTSAEVNKFCVVTVTARKYGLCATASRTVCFGEPDPELRKEFDAASKICATYIASSWPDALPKQILGAGEHVYSLLGYEHEWRLAPQGHITGRAPIEIQLLPQTADLLRADNAIVWHPSVGAAASTDTFLVSDQGPQLVTTSEMWPLKRIKIQGGEFFRPDILVRS